MRSRSGRRRLVTVRRRPAGPVRTTPRKTSVTHERSLIDAKKKSCCAAGCAADQGPYRASEKEGRRGADGIVFHHMRFLPLRIALARSLSIQGGPSLFSCLRNATPCPWLLCTNRSKYIHASSAREDFAVPVPLHPRPQRRTRRDCLGEQRADFSSR